MFEVVALVDGVEVALEIVEELEGWFAHEVEYTVRCVFGRNLEPSADMVGYEFFCVLSVDGVYLVIARVVQKEVVSDSRTYEAFLDAWYAVDGTVYVEQLAVVSVEVRAYFRVYARRTLAFVAKVKVASVHGIHVGRWSSEVAEVAFEVWHGGDGLDFSQDTFLAS